MKCLRAFDMGEVTVLDGYCVNALEKEIRYLTSFDPDRLLAGFRETAGLDTKNAVRYGGWEKMLIGGHTMGHYLSAMAQAYANPGVSAEDKEKILGLLTYICDELLKCQNHSAGKPGFLFGAAMTGEGGVEAQFDRVEKGQTNIITESWVPWYTMHKLLAGLVSVWEYVRLESALETAKGIGDWTYNRASGWTEQVHKTVLSIEYGGMNDALYELFACTGIEKYAEAAGYFDDEELFGLIAGGGKDVLNNRHANTTIPKFLGALNRYVTVHGKMMDGRKRDESRFFEYAAAFWDMVVERHTYITGGNSEWEHFGADYVLNGERTACNNETCNVHNMLKLTRGLFMITGEKKYADYYENAFYNTILSSQDPSTGMTTYFQPMANGYFKTYSEPFTKFWCCTGTGMENFTKLNDSIYFHGEDERKRIYVNMYLTSLIEAEEYGISLKLEADLPYDEKVALEITAKEESADVDLCFRIPDWLDKGKKPGRFILMKNGQAVECEETCGYALLRGPFETQDVISFVLPMTVRACGLPDDERVFGFKYGPVVLSSDLGDERMDTTVTGVDVTVPARRIPGREYITLPEGASRQDFVTDTQRFFRKTGMEETFPSARKEQILSFHRISQNTGKDTGFITGYLLHRKPKK